MIKWDLALEWIVTSGCIESEGFHMREFNTILGSCGFLRTAQSVFESVPEDADLS